MQQREVVLYIAMSVDGYIAKEDGDINWLSVVDTPNEDYGYNEFISTIDTVIMGRKTYDKVLTFGIKFPHKDRKCYVLSNTKTGKDENVEFYRGDLIKLIMKIRKENSKNIFIDGGAETVFELMKTGIIDKFVISIIPVILGSGISLFKSGSPEHKLKLTGCKSFNSGLVQLFYEKQK